MADILQRIDDLVKRVRDEDKQIAQGMRREAEKLLLMSDIRDHDAIKFIVKEYGNQVRDMDSLLLKANSKILNDKDRDVMLAKKEFVLDFLSMFTDVDKLLENLEKEVKEQEDFVANQS